MSTPVPEQLPAALSFRVPEASQSVDRAVGVLRVLAVDGPLRMTELARRMGIQRQVLQRLLNSLERACLVRRDAVTRRYDLGIALAVLGRQAEQRIDVARLATPHLQALATATGGCATLLVRQGSGAVCAGVEMADGLAPPFPIGRTVPLWQGVARVILAFVGEPERSHLMAVSPLEDLPVALRTIVDRGHAVIGDDVVAGMVGVGAPVFDACGRPVAALVAMGPHTLAQPARTAAVVRQAAALSAALGRLRANGGQPSTGRRPG